MPTFTEIEKLFIKDIFTQYLSDPTLIEFNTVAEPYVIDSLCNHNVIVLTGIYPTHSTIEITNFAKSFLILCNLFVIADNESDKIQALINYFLLTYGEGNNG